MSFVAFVETKAFDLHWKNRQQQRKSGGRRSPSGRFGPRGTRWAHRLMLSNSESNREVVDRSKDITIHRLERGNTTQATADCNSGLKSAEMIADNGPRHSNQPPKGLFINTTIRIQSFGGCGLSEGTQQSQVRDGRHKKICGLKLGPLRRDGSRTEDGTQQSTTKGFDRRIIDRNNNQPKEERFA
jgi:hypothetical protein